MIIKTIDVRPTGKDLTVRVEVFYKKSEKPEAKALSKQLKELRRRKFYSFTRKAGNYSFSVKTGKSKRGERRLKLEVFAERDTGLWEALDEVLKPIPRAGSVQQGLLPATV